MTNVTISVLPRPSCKHAMCPSYAKARRCCLLTLFAAHSLVTVTVTTGRSAGLLDDDVELPAPASDVGTGTAVPLPAAVSPAHKRRRILRLREIEQQGSSPSKPGDR